MSDETRTVSELLDSGDTVTLTTADGRGRPMTVSEVVDGTVWFLTRRSADWVEALHDGTTVGVHANDGDDGRWVSLVGTASQVDDRDRIEELWTVVSHAWFDGPDDPDLCALAVVVTDGEWWESHGSTIARAVRLGAAMAIDDVGTGDQGDVDTA